MSKVSHRDKWRWLLAVCVCAHFVLPPPSHASAQEVAPWQKDGRVAISSMFNGSRATIEVTRRFGGAIASFRWRNKEFVNIYDHGRQIQSAASFDALGECYNPTEAGSKEDGRGSASSSRVIDVSASATHLRTTTAMAFWASPGGTTGGCPRPSMVRNSERVSDIVLVKDISFGAEGIPNTVDHQVTFKVPRHYGSAVFEALTAYLRPEFSQFWTFDPASGQRNGISDGPGEQNAPLIFSTPDHRYAFGVYSPGLPQPAWLKAGYGRWRFANLPGPGNATVKWNCVFREKDIKAGDYSYRCTSIFGTLQDVETAMMELHRIRGRKAN